MQRTASEEHERSDTAARQKVTLESSEKLAKFACRRTQRQEESNSAGDAIPAVDSARGEECIDTLHSRCTALHMEESCNEEANMVAAVRRLTVQQR